MIGSNNMNDAQTALIALVVGKGLSDTMKDVAKHFDLDEKKLQKYARTRFEKHLEKFVS